MRIIHLSDMHFGTESGNIAARLTDAIQKISPQLVVISGDFTQVASSAEFQKARDFIKGLNARVFCVPGNHDIPRYDLAERFLNPYKKYKAFISPDLAPVLKGENFVIAGVNTARPILPHWNWAHGAISGRQLDKLDEVFKGADDKYKICVMHHPIHKAEKVPLKVTVFGAKQGMGRIHDLKIDLVLTGHVHHASVTAVEKTIFVSASTAISRRLRLQGNGFNMIDLHAGFLEISHFIYNGVNFVPGSILKHDKAKYA